MKTTLGVFGVLLAIGCGRSKPVDGAPDQAQGQPAAEGAPQGDSVVAYQSQTHGALQVMTVNPNSTSWFDVFQNGKFAYTGAPPLLNHSLELLPGEYVADVHRSQRPVTITAGRKTILWTGELVVEGEPATASWYPMQGTEMFLKGALALLNYALPLFPGTYTTFLSGGALAGTRNLGEAQVNAGRRTSVKL